MEKIKLYLFFMMIIQCFGNGLKAQTLHLIIVADTNDELIGAGCAINASKVKNQIGEMARLNNMTVELHLYAGDVVDTVSLFKTINNLRITEEDAVLFHYSGHGRNEGENNKWPRLLAGNMMESITLEDIHKQLRELNPRLLITIGDCCNSNPKKIKNLARTKSGLMSDSLIGINSNGSDLFFHKKGAYIASASEIGFSAFYDNMIGGYFTTAFLEAIHHCTNDGGTEECQWDSVFQLSQSYTAQIAKGWNIEQTPQFEEMNRVKVVVYTVKKKDTLFNLSKKFNIHLNELCRLNEKSLSDKIYIGEKLVISYK